MSFIKKVIKKVNAAINEIYLRLRRKRYRKKLKNRDFTIFCQNCIGGEIYHLLGEQFLSPTVNMWEHSTDFLKLVSDPHYYLQQPLKFIQTEEPYPVAQCGDITLHFNHHTNAKDAEIDWERRKIRVNFDNLYVILYNKYLTIDQIKQVENVKCKNVVVLTDTPLPVDYAVEIKPTANRENADWFIDKDKYGVYTYEKQWDFVEWLNSERNQNKTMFT